MKRTWRDSARPLIAKALEATKGKTEQEIRKALRDAYPWGERRMHPYKIWCDEIKVQRGLKRKKIFIAKNQTDIFNG